MAEIFAIRTDATARMATGHLSRCLSVADALHSFGISPIFILGDGANFINNRKRINQRGFSAFLLEDRLPENDFPDWEHESDVLCSFLIKNHVEILIIDSYLISVQYMRSVNCCVKIAYFDDLCVNILSVNALINYNHYAKELEYDKKYDSHKCKLILGPIYAPLKADFAEDFYRDYDRPFENILITTGGTDEYHITRELALRLAKDPQFQGVSLLIAAGALNADTEELYKLEIKYESIYIYENTAQMRGLMLKADAAVSAGGSTMYELCACKCPAVTFVHADNQLPGAEGFAKKDIIPYAGDVRQDVEACLDRMTETLSKYRACPKTRRNVGEKMGAVTNGQGAKMIAKILIEEL